MSKRVLVQISKDEFISKKAAEIDAIEESSRQQLKFLEKQAKDIANKIKEDAMKIWAEIESHIVPKYVETYNAETHELQLDREADALYIRDSKDNDDVYMAHIKNLKSLFTEKWTT